VVWGLVRGNQAGWGSLEVVTTLVAGFLLAVAFVAWERRARVPMLPLRFFRSRAFSAGNAAGFLFFASLYGSAFFLARFLQTALGYGPLGAGLRLLPWTAMLFVSAPLAGVLVNRVGERTLIVGGLLLQAGAFAWIGLIARPGLTYPELIAPLLIAGFGAAAIPAGQNAVVSSVAAAEIGKASGAFNMLCYLGGVFGIVVLVAVFAHTGNFRSTQAFSEGFALPIGACASLSLAPPKEQASISLTYHSPFIKEGDSPQIIPRHKDNRGEISSVANLSEG
jgi:MFS family permease